LTSSDSAELAEASVFREKATVSPNAAVLSMPRYVPLWSVKVGRTAELLYVYPAFDTRPEASVERTEDLRQ
jgi:hypothetical protein